MCGQCHSYSNHLFGRLGPELGVMDGLTMTNEFCEELVDECSGEGQIVFPTYDGESYCEKHTGGGADLFWAYPYTEREFSVVVCVVFLTVVVRSRLLRAPAAEHEHTREPRYGGGGRQTS